MDSLNVNSETSDLDEKMKEIDILLTECQKLCISQKKFTPSEKPFILLLLFVHIYKLIDPEYALVSEIDKLLIELNDCDVKKKNLKLDYDYPD